MSNRNYEALSICKTITLVNGTKAEGCTNLYLGLTTVTVGGSGRSFSASTAFVAAPCVVLSSCMGMTPDSSVQHNISIKHISS